MDFKKLDFKSLYFSLYELKPGIFCAIFTNGASSNAGFFDLGNLNVVFDTLMDPFSTRDLIEASKRFTQKEPSVLVNSHSHIDHLFGNREFSLNIPIISSYNTFLEFENNVKNQLIQLKERAPSEIKRLRKGLSQETNKNMIKEMKNDIQAWKEIQQESFTLRPPDILINDSIKLTGIKNQLKLEYIGEAHSTGDILATFDKEKIVFMGDLLFEKTDPNWADPESGIAFVLNAERLRDTLFNYYNKDYDIYVPGHGNICTKKELKEGINFLEKYYINKQ